MTEDIKIPEEKSPRKLPDSRRLVVENDKEVNDIGSEECRQQIMSRALDLMNTRAGQEMLRQEMHNVVERVNYKISQGHENIQIESRGPEEAAKIAKGLQDKHGEQTLVLNFSTAEDARSSLKRTDQIMRAWSFQQTQRIVLIHPEATCSRDELIYLRGLASIPNFQTILICNLKEFDKKEPYARNVYHVKHDLTAGESTQPLEFDETKAKQLIDEFGDRFYGLSEGPRVELFLPPRAGKSTLIQAFEKVWDMEIDPKSAGAGSSLVLIDAHRFLAGEKPLFKEICEQVEFDIMLRRQEGQVVPLIIVDEAQELTGRQRDKLPINFPNQKFFFIAHI